MTATTNFYYRIEKGPLAKLEPLHIGLCTQRWMFHFKAYAIDAETHTLSDKTGQLRMKVTLPALSLQSAADWRAFMKENDGLIINSAGETLTVEEFWEVVQAHSKEAGIIKNPLYNRPKLENGPGKDQPELTEWRDAEDFAISRFSPD